METQQNTTENKKPRMYVSWMIIIIDLFVIVGWYALAVVVRGDLLELSKDESLFLSALVWIFAIGTGLLLASSFIKKPKFHIQPLFVNSMFVGLTILIVGLWYLPLIKLDPFAVRVFGWLFVGIFISMFINYKFQKSESELGII